MSTLGNAVSTACYRTYFDVDTHGPARGFRQSAFEWA
jgi:hypothetical protein